MTRQDIAVVGAVALATAAVALGIEFTGRLVADESPQPEIRWPVLKHGAVEITLRASKTALAPGDSPAAELEAVNSGSDSETVHVTLSLVSQPSPNRMSRSLVVALDSWKQEVDISLGAGERKTLSYTANTKAQANTLLYFRLTAGKDAVTTPPVAVPAPLAPVSGPATAEKTQISLPSALPGIGSK